MVLDKNKRKKRRVSASTKARLKALRKKHGLGEFKKNKRRSKRRGGSVAKKRRKSRRSKGSFSMRLPVIGNQGKELVGGASYGFAEPFIEQITNKIAPFLQGFGLGISSGDEIAKIVAGAFLAKQSNPFLKGMGKAAITIEAYKFSKGFALGGVSRGAKQVSDILA